MLNRFTCPNCSTIFYDYGKRLCCSKKCLFEKTIRERYLHLYKLFEENPNEVAYLFGLILGDGHNKASVNNTIKTVHIEIYFDTKQEWLINQAREIIIKLGIKLHNDMYNKKRTCVCLHFALPSELLIKYNMYYRGPKFGIQPKPSEDIIKNINFAAALINSDGSCGKLHNGERINFNNTVFSISNALKDCLLYNNIKFNHHTRNRLPDKRTNKIYKDYEDITITSKIEIDKLRKLSIFEIKSYHKMHPKIV